MLKDILTVDEDTLNNQIANFAKIADAGIVIALSDGIVTIEGLNSVANGEMITFYTSNKTVAGLILNLEHKKVSAVVLGSDLDIQPGDYVLRQKNFNEYTNR